MPSPLVSMYTIEAVSKAGSDLQATKRTFLAFAISHEFVQNSFLDSSVQNCADNPSVSVQISVSAYGGILRQSSVKCKLPVSGTVDLIANSR